MSQVPERMSKKLVAMYERGFKEILVAAVPVAVTVTVPTAAQGVAISNCVSWLETNQDVSGLGGGKWANPIPRCGGCRGFPVQDGCRYCIDLQRIEGNSGPLECKYPAADPIFKKRIRWKNE
ncbi:MAG: hypothetical protein NT002_10030 [candidate division Zixibacteria bacterium]|nr:hypothetical protein [candidate division Zixibacteria bacterium]